MGYVVNDALDELLDMIAAWLWPEEPKTSAKPKAMAVLNGVTANHPQQIHIEPNQYGIRLTPEQIAKVKWQIASRRLGETIKANKSAGPQAPGLSRIEPATPTLKKLLRLRPKEVEFAAQNQNDYGGLLGKLVAQYWIFARARMWYSQHTSANRWDDNTPIWLYKDNPWISDAKYREVLKKADWFGVGVTQKYWRTRMKDGDGSLNLWRGRGGLEWTFSNWSRPSRFNYSSNYNAVKETGHLVAPNFPYDGVKTVVGIEGQSIVDIKENLGDDFAKYAAWSFCYGWKGFDIVSNKITPYGAYKHYKDKNNGDISYGKTVFSDIVQDQKVDLDDYGRLTNVMGKKLHLQTYDFEPVLGNHYDTWCALCDYYTHGYNLVNTVLDVLLARGEKKIAFDYPDFAILCNEWWIPIPSLDITTMAPDLSAIGAGVSGLADVSSTELIDFVKKICPVPGSVAPWNDKGPLWLWPDQCGTMRPVKFDWGNSGKRRKAGSDAWGNFIQFVLGVETSICASVASGVVNTVVDMAVDAAVDSVVGAALEMSAEWLADGVEGILGALDSELGNAAFKAVLENMADVSSFCANVAHFANAQELVGDVAGSIDSVSAIKKYLDAAADNLSADAVLDDLKAEAQSSIDSILNSGWEWGEDLLGGMSSWGTTALSKINNA